MKCSIRKVHFVVVPTRRSKSATVGFTYTQEIAAAQVQTNWHSLRRVIEPIVVALFAAFVVYYVFSTQGHFITQRTPINVDESELLAAGRRAAMSYIPFKDFTGATYGPMWPLMLGWLHRLGLPLTIPVAHVLNALIICGSCVALFIVIWRRWSIIASTVVVTPILIHWAKGFNSSDFYAMTTESLPFVFLVVGCIVGFPRHAITERRAFVAALFLGSSVWSKYAFAVIVAVGLLALLVKLISSRVDVRHSVAICVGAPLLPYGVLIGWAILYQVPFWKTIESPIFTLTYLRGGGLTKATPTLGDRLDTVQVGLQHFHSFIPIGLFIIAVIILGVTADFAGGGGNRARLDVLSANGLRLAAVLSFVGAVVSLGSIVPFFPHYGYLFIAGMFQATVILSSVSSERSGLRTFAVPLAIAVAAAGAIWAQPKYISVSRATYVPWAGLVAEPAPWRKILTTDGGLWERGVSTDGRRLGQLCPRRSKVIVWGWSPDLYAHYDWIPGTRYVTTTYAITDYFGTDVNEYRKRIFADFQSEKPVCVVDGATPAQFPSWGPAFGLAVQWPEFVAGLSSSYSQQVLTLSGYSPITVWVRQT